MNLLRFKGNFQHLRGGSWITYHVGTSFLLSFASWVSASTLFWKQSFFALLFFWVEQSNHISMTPSSLCPYLFYLFVSFSVVTVVHWVPWLEITFSVREDCERGELTLHFLYWEKNCEKEAYNPFSVDLPALFLPPIQNLIHCFHLSYLIHLVLMKRWMQNLFLLLKQAQWRGVQLRSF